MLRKFKAINFPLSTTLTLSHTFLYFGILLLFSHSVKKYMISILISCVHSELFRSLFFSFKTLEDLLVFFCYWFLIWILWDPLWIISIFWNSLIFTLLQVYICCRYTFFCTWNKLTNNCHCWIHCCCIYVSWILFFLLSSFISVLICVCLFFYQSAKEVCLSPLSSMHLKTFLVLVLSIFAFVFLYYSTRYTQIEAY